jgi:fluoride exporter
MTFTQLLLVGAGGFAGSIARYFTSKTVDLKLNTLFPFGTLTVNVIGSFILGVIIAWTAKKADNSENLRLLLATGFCGGFTTFSAFAFENLNLLEQKLTGVALLYISMSLIIGVLAVYAGVSLGKNL